VAAVAARRGGGKVNSLLQQTNVVAFPSMRRGRVVAGRAVGARQTPYEFTDDELQALCRWFSAMRYAFPGTEGIMMVSHQENYSAVGLYNPGGGAPNCLVAKHEVGGTPRFFWSTEFDPPRCIGGLAEITDAHIRAIGPPRNERDWLDPAAWLGVYASRLITTQLQVV
jgi:hypothetical protein